MATTSHRLLPTALLFALAACGGSTSTPQGTDDGGFGKADFSLGGGPDQSVAKQPDLAMAVPDLTMMSMPDLSKGGGSDGGMAIMCMGPADCAGNPCCLKVKMQALEGVSCAAKPADCVPMIDFSGSGQTRVCTKAADCTAGIGMSNLPDCCVGMQGGGMIKMCFSKLLAGLSMGKVVCP